MASRAEALAEIVLPSLCGICGRGLPWRSARGSVCTSCWSRVSPHTVPCCPHCGEAGVAADDACLACRDTPPPWHSAASYGPYEGTLRELILLLKYGRRDELAAPLAELLAETLATAAWGLPDVVTAVPLSWTRALRRGFNQASLLARKLADRLSVADRRLLIRRQPTSQVGRSRVQRLRLSSTAFRARRPVFGTVLLVDDVITTGATARSCTSALLRAGAESVQILALARTPTPGRIP